MTNDGPSVSFLSEPTEYEGGIDLRNDAGCSAGVRSKFGQVYLSPSVEARSSHGQITMDLEPDEAEELAGALRRAALAARVYRGESIMGVVSPEAVSS